MKNIFTTYIDVVSYNKTAKGRLGVETEGKEEGQEDFHLDGVDVEEEEEQPEFVKFDEEEVAKFEDFARQPNCIERLVDTLAPSIWENEDVKKGALCQLFGGN